MKTINKKFVYLLLTNTLLFFLLISLGMICLGGEFFEYVGRTLHYIYFFVFKRKFDFKTVLVYIVTASDLALSSYWFMQLFKKRTSSVFELVFPFVPLVPLLLLLAAIRGWTLAVFNNKTLLLVILLMSVLALYVISTIWLVIQRFVIHNNEKKELKNENEASLNHSLNKRTFVWTLEELFENLGNDSELEHLYFYNLETYNELLDYISTHSKIDNKIYEFLEICYQLGHGFPVNYTEANKYAEFKIYK